MLDAKDNLIFVRQYRENLEDYTLEFPAGGIIQGESPKEAIEREVYEEAGLKIRAKYLGEGYLLMDRCKNPDYLFFGYEDCNTDKPIETSLCSEFPVVKIPRLHFADRLRKGNFKQLGALSVIALIDYSFNIRFLDDPYSILLEKGLFS
ncbi:NUDIX hydrolase [Paracoccaceae bacterium]|nr:NUDIX hydrolase [Paracoccaceae bacterium]